MDVFYNNTAKLKKLYGIHNGLLHHSAIILFTKFNDRIFSRTSLNDPVELDFQPFGNGFRKK